MRSTIRIGGVTVFLLLVSGAGFFAWKNLQSSLNQLTVPVSARAAHVYKNEKKPVGSVRLKVVYAVPKNKRAAISSGWRAPLEASLAKLKAFHDLQFRGSSRLRYDIFPDPVVLKNDSLFYDSEETGGGNPHALVAIGEEIESRLMHSDGDLFSQAFASRDPEEYAVLALVYEGVGASGGVIYESSLPSVSEIAKQWGIPESIIYQVNITSADGFLILNRDYLSAPNGPTLFYHEFAHTIGVPDFYDPATDAARSDDIMGGGRAEPIENTYIETMTLKGMGAL